jgi:hypothetical protein
LARRWSKQLELVGAGGEPVDLWYMTDSSTGPGVIRKRVVDIAAVGSEPSRTRPSNSGKAQPTP